MKQLSATLVSKGAKLARVSLSYLRMRAISYKNISAVGDEGGSHTPSIVAQKKYSKIRIRFAFLAKLTHTRNLLWSVGAKQQTILKIPKGHKKKLKNVECDQF